MNHVKWFINKFFSLIINIPSNIEDIPGHLSRLRNNISSPFGLLDNKGHELWPKVETYGLRTINF